MSESLEPDTLLREVAALQERLTDLRNAAAVPDADLTTVLDAALSDLDLALSALRSAGTDGASAQDRSSAGDTERRLLRTVFTDAPVPLLLLDRDGTVRRVNRQAGALLGTSPGYLAGKSFPVFCDLTTRATIRSQLAAVLHSGQRRRARIRLLSQHGPVNVDVTLALATINGEPDPLVIMATAPSTDEPVRDDPARDAGESDDLVATLVHRMDVFAAATELLLEDRSFTESVVIRRCARLLASELADWVIVDVAGDDRLVRQVVIGPADERSAGITRALEELPPASGTLPAIVHESRQAVLHTHIDDVDLLGVGPGNVPMCGLIGAVSVMSVPLDDGEHSIGALTLAVSGDQGPLELMDLGLVERLARNLALVIRAGRHHRKRSEVADALQANLLPQTLPEIPGVAIAGRYLAATRGIDIGGDFYDVFAHPAGWGFVLGDVCGKGEAAAAVTATARHGIRLLARWNPKPAEVLSMVNETLLDQDRFVTAVMACMEQRHRGVSVTLASAGHPPAIVIRNDGTIRALAGGGVPLGLFDEDFEISNESLDLDPGDTLLLHSDGVLDACDLMNDRFGHERLIEVLAVHAGRPVAEMVAGLGDALMSFCGDDLRDDVSILAVRVDSD